MADGGNGEWEGFLPVVCTKILRLCSNNLIKVRGKIGSNHASDVETERIWCPFFASSLFCTGSLCLEVRTKTMNPFSSGKQYIVRCVISCSFRRCVGWGNIGRSCRCALGRHRCDYSGDGRRHNTVKLVVT
jgi:hypothetical protein